jgi:hypothetical protein
MPCGARGQLLAFQQHNVFPAHLGQMIGDRGTRDATANYDGTGFGRDRGCTHGQKPFKLGMAPFCAAQNEISNDFFIFEALI